MGVITPKEDLFLKDLSDETINVFLSVFLSIL